MAHTHSIDRYSPGIIRRLLLALGVVNPLKPTDVKPNWHWKDVGSDAYLTTITGVRDGVPYCRVAHIPPECQARRTKCL